MTDKDEIIVCERRLLQAMKDCNVEALGELLHDELLFNAAGGITVTKEMDINAYKTGTMVVDNITPREQQISTFGDTAVVVVTAELAGWFMKEPINDKVKFLRIWKKFDDRYQVIAGSSTILP
ncbi:MAG: nuclear transport factor 2 family protein [Dysgonomonas sp.]